MSLTPYQPDPMVMAGCDWARRRGLRNCDFSAVRVGDRVEIRDCRHGMAITVAWVSVNTEGTSQFRIDRT